MKKENKKKLLIVTAILLSVIGTLTAIFYPNLEVNNTIGEYQNIVIDEIQSIDENVIVEDITENEEISSTENTVERATFEEERALEDEEVTEVETFELQDEENISYDGDRAKSAYILQSDRQQMEEQFIYIYWK